MVQGPALDEPPSSPVAPGPVAPAQAASGQVALDANTIQHLHSTLRAVPRPLLESLTRAFRKRFQVPEVAPTIADRISQRCHHGWIEAFLVQHQLVQGGKLKVSAVLSGARAKILNLQAVEGRTLPLAPGPWGAGVCSS
jgi:hypothetical protein